MAYMLQTYGLLSVFYCQFSIHSNYSLIFISLHSSKVNLLHHFSSIFTAFVFQESRHEPNIQHRLNFHTVCFSKLVT